MVEFELGYQILDTTEDDVRIRIRCRDHGPSELAIPSTRPPILLMWCHAFPTVTCRVCAPADPATEAMRIRP